MDFDFISIGAGSGGLAASIRAARHGAKCAIIEQNKLGGTCVNVGCVPKKVMWYAASIAEHLKLSEDYGFQITKNSFSWDTLVKKREEYIKRIHGAYDKTIKNLNIKCISGNAKLIDKNTVQVGEKKYTAKHVLI